MNAITAALTSALVDFVWQGTLIGLAAAAGMRVRRRCSARSRYLLGIVALATLMAAPVVTTASHYASTELRYRGAVTLAPGFFGQSADDERAALMTSSVPAPVLTRIQPWVLPIWSLGVLLLSLRLVVGGIELRTLRRSGTAADNALCERVSCLALRMGIGRPIHLVMSARAEGPSVIGWLRPVILLPPAAAMGLTTAQLDAVLAHELAHIRRHDYVVNVVQMVAETLLFYHPAVWWVSNRIRAERELCCDDEAVAACGDAPGYASALVTLARHQISAAMAMGIGGSLTDRVRHLLGAAGDEPRRSTAVGIAVVVALIPIALVSVSAQRERLRFEVASVKPAIPSAARGFSGAEFLPGGVVRSSRSPLWFLIASAYDLRLQQVDGESPVLQERFAIDARANPSALPPESAAYGETVRRQIPVLREMLQTLLAERFKLAFHVEKRDSPIYALVVGPKGHKLTRAAKDCEITTAAEAASGGPCGAQGGGPASGLRMRGAELEQLADALTSLIGRIVIDRTGVSGRFDIDLPPWSTGQPPRTDSDEPQPDPNGTTIFTVLQQELGLRLEATRGPIDYYVVDHVEPPTPD